MKPIKFKAELPLTERKRKAITLRRARELAAAGREKDVEYVEEKRPRPLPPLRKYFEILPPSPNPAIEKLRKKLKKFDPTEKIVGDRIYFSTVKE